MKRKLAAALVMLLTISSLCACGNKNETVPDAPDTVVTDAAETTETANAEGPDAQANADETETADLTEAYSDTDDKATIDTAAEEDNDDNQNSADASVNYLQFYAPVFSRVHYVITYPLDDFEYADGEEWLQEVSRYNAIHKRLEDYGYCLKDISGDGIPELLFTAKDGETIYNLYTLVNNEPYLVFSGYFKNTYAYAGDNLFEWFVSAGGMYQKLATYKLSENGQEMIPVDYYFTCESASREERECFYNTIGESDKEKSESIGNDGFDNEWVKYEEKIVPLEYIPFAEKTIEVAYVEDNPGQTVSGSYVTDVTEYAHKVIVYDKNGMNSIKLMGLKMLDITERGDIVFDSYDIYEMHDTNGDEATELTVTFSELAPDYGISYIDSNGILREFAIDISGDDGSVYLWEY